jgi:von Willebrand factor type A domain
MKEKMSLRKWYGTSVRLPEIGNYSFIDFAVSCLGIVRSLVEKELGNCISVTFMKGGTAHANWDTKTIAINEDYLEGRIGPAHPQLTSDEALQVILGIEVHEAAHFAFSPQTTLPFVEFVKAHSKCAIQEDVISSIGNVIEDIYIEAESDREAPSLTWMLEAMNETFFAPFSVEERLSKAAHIEEAPESLPDVITAINLLILAKAKESLETTPFLAKLFSQCRSATELSFLEERLELTLEIYNSLMEKITQEECDNSASKDSEIEEAVGEMKRMAAGLTPSHEDREGEIEIEGIKNLAEGIATVVRKMESMKVTYDQKDEEPGTTSLYLEEVLAPGYLVVADKRYSPLVEVARQRSTINRPYGQDMNRGHSMRKLYRIASDGKIFAQPVTMSNYSPMEVIIMVDCSGSMNNPIFRTTTRLEAAAQAALGAAEALAEGRCSVAVYGHTADIVTHNDVMIYTAKRFSEPISVLSSRLGTLVEGKPHRENRDGYALAYIARKFTKSNKRKMLIVISDGEPAAMHYHGSPAIEHTRRGVNDVRKLGIDVLSISITKEAEAVNNRIYGAKDNVYNESPNVIAEIVRSLILG